jgi:16S rRNA A1518/A1519 N6-dimethyltransferase RsmA/KsgA/DIM1 with predicted DNA glycosylase/AP lyase activity
MVFMLVRTGVPFIPTPDKVVEAMMKTVKFRGNLTIYELGCGNGKMMFKIKEKCDKLGLENMQIKGYELIAPLVWWIKSRRKLQTQTSNKISVFSRDFFKQDLSDADIIFCYLFPHLMQRISREIWPQLKKGTILVSHAFKIDDIPAKKVIKTAGTTIYVYEK